MERRSHASGRLTAERSITRPTHGGGPALAGGVTAAAGRRPGDWLKSLVAAAVAVLLFQAAYVAPVTAAVTAAPVAVAPVPEAGPPAADPLELDPADEVVTARTETTRAYDLGDGRMAVEAFADPVFYQPTGSRDWLPIDLDFAVTGDGATAVVEAAPVRVTVGAQPDGLVAVEHRGYRIALRPIEVTPAADAEAADRLDGVVPPADRPIVAEPVVLDASEVSAALAAPIAAGRPAPDRQRVDLPDVLPGVDLRVFAHPYGTSNFLVLAERPEVSSWTFAVTAPGLTLVPGAGGALEFVDRSGTPFAAMPAPYAVDSTPDEATGSGRTTTAAWYTLTTLGERQLVTVSVDPSWLADAVYPVYVDPSQSIYNDGQSANGDTHVNAGNPTFNYANYQRPDSPYTYEMWLGESPSDPTYFNMDFIQFNLDAYYGNIVDSATLEVRPYHQYYNPPTSSRAWLRRVTASWTESITWNTKPAVTSTGLTFADCVEGAQCGFNVTGLTGNWFDGDYLDAGVRIDEINADGEWKGPTFWKRLIASEQQTGTRPRIIFTYHNPVTVVAPNAGPTSSRTLSWATESGWGQDAYRVEVSTSPTFSPTLVTSGDVTSSTAREWPIPSGTTLTAGTTYHWRVRARRTTARATTMWSPYAAGSFTWDPGANLGLQRQHTTESFDLGAGDSLDVNVATGNLVLTHPVVDLPIRGGTLPITLAYNSHDTADVGMGPGWRLNVLRRLAVDPVTGDVTFTDSDGSRHLFDWNGSGYVRPAAIYATLTKTAGTPNVYTLRYRDQSVDVFHELATGVAYLKEAGDRFGNTVVFGYTGTQLTSAADPAGRTIAFGWTGGQLTSVRDWAAVDGTSHVVLTSGTPNRTTTFFYAGGTLQGWADPYAPGSQAACPSASHTVCLGYTGGLLTTIARLRTVTTAGASALGTTTVTDATTVAYRGTEVASIRDASQAAVDATSFARPAAGQVVVLRHGTPDATTTYGLQAATDPYGRVATVTRSPGAGVITSRTDWDTTYPTEPASITENFVDGTPSDTAPAEDRVTSYSYLASSMGLVSRITEPLTASTHRTSDYTYNANNDVTQRITALDGSGSIRTITRSCYHASTCNTTDVDPRLWRTIEHYVDGTAGNGTAPNVEDVTTTFGYDAYGQQTRETILNYQADGTHVDQVTGFVYDASGNLTSEIRNYANGTVTSPGDDITPNSSTNTRTDLTTTYGYDTAGNRITTADPRRAILAATGSPGLYDYLTTLTFDPLGQQLSEKTPTTPGISIIQKTATTAYDELGNVREATDFGGLVTGTEYDAAGRATKTFEDTASTNPDVSSEATYDAAGRVLTAKDRRQYDTPSLGVTATTYDGLGRTTSVTEASGSSPDIATITATTYDALDRVLTEDTGDGTASEQRTTYTYDLGGRVLRTDDEFTCTTREYDYRDLVTGELQGLEPGTCGGTAQRAVTSSYDGLGRLILSEITAGEGDGDVLEATTYDAAGPQRSTSSTRAGVTTSSAFAFNALDEVVAETRLDGGTAVSWTRSNYDPAGNPTDRCVWSTDPGAEWCRAVGEGFDTDPAVHTSTGYDARNNRVSLKLPALGETTYDPDHNYQVAAIYVPTGSGKELQTLYHYDERHRVAGDASTAGIVHQLCTISSGHACSATVALGSDDYQYDDNDNRIQVEESRAGGTASTLNYCYDGLNRLRAMKSGAACSLTSGDELFEYDDAGNRRKVVAGSTTWFRYSGAGQLCQSGTADGSCPADPATWQIRYDDTGRTSFWNSWYLTYDGEGRLASACKVAGCATGDMVTMRYDGEGRRVELVTRPNGGAATTTTFRYQGTALAQELVGGVLARTYVTDEAGRIVKVCDPDCGGSNPQYLVTWSGHGDALALWQIGTGGSLTLVNSFGYSTWGTPTVYNASGTPIAWTDPASLRFRFLYVGAYGVAWDDLGLGLGLQYMSARHYSPSLGRFLQPDPSAAEANLYGYVGNSPVTRVDPHGLFFNYPMNPEEKRQCSWHPAECYLVKFSAGWAEFYSWFYSGQRRDAMRHCMWSCLMRYYVGEKRATMWGVYHEEWDPVNSDRSRNQKAVHLDHDMDYWNNWVGRMLGSHLHKILWAHTPWSGARELCNEALHRGYLRVKSNGRLTPSS